MEFGFDFCAIWFGGENLAVIKPNLLGPSISSFPSLVQQLNQLVARNMMIYFQVKNENSIISNIFLWK